MVPFDWWAFRSFKELLPQVWQSLLVKLIHAWTTFKKISSISKCFTATNITIVASNLSIDYVWLRLHPKETRQCQADHNRGVKLQPLKFSHFEIKDQSPGKNKSGKYWVKLCSFANLRKLHFEETSRSNDKIQNAKRKNAITGKAPKCLSTLQLLTTIKFGISSPNMTWKEIAYLFHFDDTRD